LFAVNQIGSGEQIEAPVYLSLMLTAGLAKRAVDGLLDRPTAQLRSCSAQGLLVDVH
jgi:hypothetical protein